MLTRSIFFRGLLGCTVLLSLAGCKEHPRSNRDGGGEKTPSEISRTASDGPVTLTLTAAPAEIEATQAVKVTIAAVTEKGVAVDVVDYGRLLREDVCRFDCRILRSDKSEARPVAGDKLHWTYRYELEFILPGTYELPPAVLSYVDGRTVPQSPSAELAAPPAQPLKTESLTLLVRPAPSGNLSDAELRSINTLNPIELPARWSRWWWQAPLIFILPGLAAYILLYLAGLISPPLRRLLSRLHQRLRRKTLVASPPPLPADEWARRELARLLTERLVAAGRFREFYYRVSDIIRGYVERRFDVSAPDMTTEEFLAAAATDRRFGEDITEALIRFLGACDLVKYAGYRPDFAEADGLLAAAERFIERTTGPTVEIFPATSPQTLEESIA